MREPIFGHGLEVGAKAPDIFKDTWPSQLFYRSKIFSFLGGHIAQWIVFLLCTLWLSGLILGTLKKFSLEVDDIN